MTILTEGNNSFYFTTSASLVENDRDIASTWASKHIVANDQIKWVLGKYVEADNANSNGQYWSLDDLRLKKTTILHSPMNIAHRQKDIVGTFVAADILYPTDENAKAVNAYIETLGAFWKYYFPNELKDIESAYSTGSLFLSMECIGDSVTCGECGETAAYAGPMSETYCQHIQDRSAYRQLNNPHFLGGALILPPDRPGWRGAEVKEISKMVSDNVVEAERIYSEVAKANPQAGPDSWESTMHQLLMLSRTFKKNTSVISHSIALSSAAAENLSEGDFVSFEMDDEIYIGSVEHIMTDGYFGTQGSRFYVEATSEDPAVLIRIWEDGEETEVLTGRMMSEIEKVDPSEIIMYNDDEFAAESYAIPDSVRQNARRGLELRKKFGRGGTSVGLNTARTLAAGGSIGIEKVKHINRYFPRHEGDNLSDKTSNGWIAWQLWGGSAAWSWTNRIVRSYEAQSDNSSFDHIVLGKRIGIEALNEVDRKIPSLSKYFDKESRMKLAKEGKAMSDGSFPIESIQDLKNAIRLAGQASDPSAARDHIKKRAKALGATDLLPEKW